MGRPRDCSGEIFRQLTEAYEKIERLEKEKIPDIISRKDGEKRKMERELKDEISKLRVALKEKDEELAMLKEELAKERNEIGRLKSILNNNPQNTSTPPSQGQAGLDPHSHRPKSQNEYNDRDAEKDKETKRKKGGQKAHVGKTFTKDDVKELLRKYKGQCEHEIHYVGVNTNGKYRVKYVIGMKIIPVIREYRYYDDAVIPPEHFSDVTYDSSVIATAGYCYGECNMPTDKIGQLLSVITGGMIKLSEGTCYNLCRKLANMAEMSLEQLKEDLLNGEVLYTDATYTKENGKETYVRNASNDNTVVYSPQDSKTIEEIGNTAVIKDFRGIVMADHETALKHYGKENAECNQHAGRYCRKNKDQTGHSWTDEFMDLLYEIKDEKKKLMDNGVEAFSDDKIEDYFGRYDEILRKGWEQNKDEDLLEYARDDERANLRRFEKYKEDHLRFATDFKVDFTNNRSESDIRIFKTRTKATGGFRQKSGREICCNILSIIRTCKKRKMPIFSSLEKIATTRANIFAPQH